MSRHRYGQGNGPTLARHRARTRQIVEHAATTDERDMGVRMIAVERLGLDGERREVVVSRSGREFPSAAKLFRHASRLWFMRDADGNLPFGVW